MTSNQPAAPRRIVITLDENGAIESADLDAGLTAAQVTEALRVVFPSLAPSAGLTEFRLRRLAALRAQVKQELRSQFVFCEGCRRRLRPEDDELYYTDEDGIATCPTCVPLDDCTTNPIAVGSAANEDPDDVSKDAQF